MAIPTEAGEEVHRLQLRALLELARASFEAARGSADLSHVLAAGAAVLEAERASFWRYDDDRRTLHCEHLYVRIDARRPLAELLAEGYQFSVTFLQPGGVRLSSRKLLEWGRA